jgi:large subunit ribosomal protein L18
MDRNRELRRKHIRKSRGTRRRVLRRGGRPRLAVFRSNRFIYAQVIDDIEGKTLASASSREADLAKAAEGTAGKCGIAASVGTAVAERAREKGVEQVVFDRRYYKYHGRVKALADAARKAGLNF